MQVLQEYADYYLHLTPIKKWDVCASDALLRSHHGRLTTLRNQTIDYNHHTKEMIIKDGLVATWKRNHQDILHLLSNANLPDYLSKMSNKHG
jgi:Golgi-resident PAP phosphatase